MGETCKLISNDNNNFIVSFVCVVWARISNDNLFVFRSCCVVPATKEILTITVIAVLVYIIILFSSIYAVLP